MAEPSKLTEMQAEAYLKRMGIENICHLDLPLLNKLVCAHQRNIPFETIDIREGQTPPSLTIEATFDKAITRRRGGYCFELNFLFKVLLETLGFDVSPVACRVVMGQDLLRPVTHRGTLVRCEGETRYVDVGYGGPIAAGALLFEDGIDQHIENETYRMRRIDNAWWAVDRVIGQAGGLTEHISEGRGTECDGSSKAGKHDSAPKTGMPSRIRTEIKICTAVMEDIDFHSMNLFCSRPGYRFYDDDIANLRTETGHRSLENDILTIRENGITERRTLADKAAFDKAVEECFGFRP